MTTRKPPTRPTKPSSLPTSVHSLQTNPHTPLTTTYRRFLEASATPEYQATMDALEQSTRYTLTGRLARVKACRTRAWFVVHRETRKVKVLGNACGDRWCPFCSRSKAAKIAESLRTYLGGCSAPKLATFTLKSGDEALGDQLTSLYAALRKLRRYPPVAQAWSGGVYFAQVTYNQTTDQWHPHLHVIIDSPYIRQDTYSKLWKKATGTSPIMDIRSIRSHKGAAKYVSRYVARPCNLKDLPPNRRQDLIYELAGRHLTGTFGTARKQKAITPPKFNKEEWYYAMTWDRVANLKATGSSELLIYDCWITGRPLPDFVDLSTSACREGFTVTFIDVDDFPRWEEHPIPPK